MDAGRTAGAGRDRHDLTGRAGGVAVASGRALDQFVFSFLAEVRPEISQPMAKPFSSILSGAEFRNFGARRISDGDREPRPGGPACLGDGTGVEPGVGAQGEWPGRAGGAEPG